ncbi:MAG: glycogen-binding domain-containing protein [Spirochaetaceae bacterium]|jgi:hypothetical protein|nr:glycogen-binding domain-containing protein [Spirochaetaceae bacterium]
MKKYTVLTFLMVIIGTIGALDTESYQFIDHLLRLSGPVGPELFEDGVIFTVPATYRRVGVAFAHEGFAKIYWFKKLLSNRNEPPPQPADSKKAPEIYQDSGILFYAHEIPQNLRELEYRLIIDGLWTTDPLNPQRHRDKGSGLLRSVVSLPEGQSPPTRREDPPGSLRFTYRAPPGETVTVAGNFNGWDPFMYELRETTPGLYSLVLPLPPGTYHYVFYHRGEGFPDPDNFNRVYTKDAKPASEAVVR